MLFLTESIPMMKAPRLIQDPQDEVVDDILKIIRARWGQDSISLAAPIRQAQELQCVGERRERSSVDWKGCSLARLSILKNNIYLVSDDNKWASFERNQNLRCSLVCIPDDFPRNVKAGVESGGRKSLSYSWKEIDLSTLHVCMRKVMGSLAYPFLRFLSKIQQNKRGRCRSISCDW